ncbi:hypothetical protein ACLOAU_01935 [Niabella sp. CJ426]|uniref:hypothetical protein n=1 Tax=Niabella sp. CJ426 TaxID=3393740 RepID=UPI003D0689F8
MKIATDIKTEDWEKIIRTLVKEGWKVRSKYRGIDEGVDYDHLVLQKKPTALLLAGPVILKAK